ncbi:MAG: putative rane protein [Acidobacteria bacterium]|nr:putative rane protein [Acidobacteriota bacterium]
MAMELIDATASRPLVWASDAQPRLTRGELVRKSYHVLGGAVTFVIRYLTPRTLLIASAIVLLWNTSLWFLMPNRGRMFWRSNERSRGVPTGVILYSISGLLLAIVFFHTKWMTAAISAVLGFGDGLATIIGRLIGGPVLPWNRTKSWAGSAAFVLFGSSSSAAVIAWTLHGSFLSALPIGLALASICAAVESLPLPIDDNITVPLAGALSLPLLAMLPALAV